MTKEERLEYKKEKNRENQKKCVENNKEKIKEYRKEYYKNNKEKSIEYHKNYYEKNKDIINKKQILYSENNKDKIFEKHKKYREKNKEKSKKYREDNKQKLKEYKKEYFQNNKEKIYLYLNNKKKTDTLFKLRCTLRSRTLKAFKNKNLTKSKTTLDMLGCDLQTAKAHLEKQFTKGMTWENQGAWHIDHIIPCASAKTEEELIKLFHYTNLQPLWAADNLSKSDKIIEKQLFLL